MNQIANTKGRAGRFHGQLDNEFTQRPDVTGATTGTKHLIIQEREVSYRFHLHQHPYVQQLTQRLLRQGASGLLAADTEYSTRLKVLKVAAARHATGGVIQLAVGELLHLGDGATLTINDRAARLAGSKVLDMLDELPIVTSNSTLVRVPAGAKLYREQGACVVLDAPLNAVLAEGGPTLALSADVFTETRYRPSALVELPLPVKNLDFSSSGAYSIYNWELFFHAPLTIAIQLSKNQRFAEAQRWFHYVFDPTDDSSGPTPERFWKVLPFQNTDVKNIEEMLVNIATGADETLRNETIRSIEAWKDAPFRPHVIARHRQQAYLYKTVMAYLDNLIAWGDALFRQDTGEAIDEAMMLYVLAANILGPRPQAVPKKGETRAQSYANLRRDLRQFGTVMRDVEADIPFDLMPFPASESADEDRLVTLRSIGKSLYFGVPRNEKLLGYWDTVADRLFKIRNSQSIGGVFRQLALFEPPIDPVLLTRAVAAGLDVGAIVSGLNQPLPLVRFQLLVQKAIDICQEVTSLGNSLLSAMEKEDGEALSILRARQERVVMELADQIKYAQLQEASKSREGLVQSLASAVQRYTYYELQLGKKSDEIEKAIPVLDELDKESLLKMKFAMQEPVLQLRKVEVDIDTGRGAQAALPGDGGKLLSSHEVRQSVLLQAAQMTIDFANGQNAASALAYLVPEVGANAQPLGVGATIQFGGKEMGASLATGASMTRTLADRLGFSAGRAGRIDSFIRREREWTFQSNLAAGEINQIFKQLRAAEIRQAITELDLKNHRQQIKHSQEIEHFLNEEGANSNGKKTNKSLYVWMRREVKGLYSQCFQFAFDIAKKAERALQHELGNPGLSYLQFGYLAGKEGLLAGEKLYFDIKRMDMAYHDLNQREYELTRHVSLLQVDPLALVQLRNTGRCTMQLPESMFDMDGPGQYFRRIKTLTVSIPCVTGPYASVNLKLTLLRSSIRKTPALRDGVYERDGAEDERFSDYYGSLQSIVTSSAQNDGGLFETNLRDERYLPFENSGVISEWQLELPANPSNGDPVQFDYSTISDVIFHVRYTAREGGVLLRQAALTRTRTLIDEAQAVGSVRLFSVRHEFPTEWAKFRTQTPGDNQRHVLTLSLRDEHYPFIAVGRLQSVMGVEIVARSKQPFVPESIDIYDKAERSDSTANKDTLRKDAAYGGLLIGKLADKALPDAPVGQMSFFFDDNAIDEAWIAVTWSSEDSLR